MNVEISDQVEIVGEQGKTWKVQKSNTLSSIFIAKSGFTNNVKIGTKGQLNAILRGDCIWMIKKKEWPNGNTSPINSTSNSNDELTSTPYQEPISMDMFLAQFLGYIKNIDHNLEILANKINSLNK